MSVKIRLMKFGKKDQPKYRLVVIDEGKKRSGRYIEKIGFYDPIPNPHLLRYDKEKLTAWLKKGAQLSKGLQKLLKRKIKNG